MAHAIALGFVTAATRYQCKPFVIAKFLMVLVECTAFIIHCHARESLLCCFVSALQYRNPSVPLMALLPQLRPERPTPAAHASVRAASKSITNAPLYFSARPFWALALGVTSKPNLEKASRSSGDHTLGPGANHQPASNATRSI